MNRLAAILSLRAAGSDIALSADPAIAAAHRVEADLAQRNGPAGRADVDSGLLMQAGTGAPRRQGPLTLVGDLSLTDLPDLRRTLAADPAADLGRSGSGRLAALG